MSNPKRKVTDLLPSEAILISSDADLKVLEEFENEGYYWEFGEKPTQWNPIQVGYALPISVYSVADKYNIISFYPSEYNLYSIQLPATDFIPTESDEVEEGSTIESVFKLAKWILENRVSSIIDSDIPQEDKDRIARHFGYSADLTNP